MTELNRAVYADLFGPTTGDRIRLADTDLLVEVEGDRSGGPGLAGDTSPPAPSAPTSPSTAPVVRCSTRRWRTVPGCLVPGAWCLVPGGWDGGAVLGGHRAVGQLLFVDPAFEDECPETRLLGPTAALTRLAGPGVLVTAVAPDARLLRTVLDGALDELLDAGRK